MRVATARSIGPRVGGVRTFAAGPVNVVAVLLDVLINEREDRFAAAWIAILFVA